MQEQSESFKRMELYRILHSILLLHPVKEVPDDVYALALKKPMEERDGSVIGTQSMDVLLLSTTRFVLDLSVGFTRYTILITRCS